MSTAGWIWLGAGFVLGVTFLVLLVIAEPVEDND
jgi:hypothetical protein